MHADQALVVLHPPVQPYGQGLHEYVRVLVRYASPTTVVAGSGEASEVQSVETLFLKPQALLSYEQCPNESLTGHELNQVGSPSTAAVAFRTVCMVYLQNLCCQSHEHPAKAVQAPRKHNHRSHNFGHQ